jgi:hypothetical protein
MLASRETNHPDTTKSGDASEPVIIAMALPLSEDERGAMQQALGERFVVTDIRRAARNSAVVVVPPCSPGAIAALLQTFPMAQVLVVEPVADTGDGPVGRALSKGASSFVRTDGAAGLAESIRWAQSRTAAA